MPSPEDLLTLPQIAAESGVPIRTLEHWTADGILKKRGYRNQGTPIRRWCIYRWADVQTLLVNYRPGKLTMAQFNAFVPEGYIRSDEAGRRLRCSSQAVRDRIRAGMLRGKKIDVPFLTKTRTFVFAEEAHVAELVAAKAAKKAEEHVERPLISANHMACLAARRQLFEQNGRVFRASKNGVDREKRAG